MNTHMNPQMIRLYEVAREAGLAAPADLSRKMNKSLQVLKNWEGRGISKEGLLDAQSFFGVRAEWLKSGQGARYMSDVASKGQKQASDANVEPIELPRAMDVPLISWVQAGAWGEIVDNFAPGDAEEWMICPKRHGPHTFGLRVRGVSMASRYNDGDIIFVDPDASADHGKNVVVRLENEKEATFKQLVIEDGRKFLRALNPEWTPRIMEINERATICGVVIGKWVPE